MLPLGDNIPARRFPITNLLLIVANVWVFYREILAGPRVERVILRYSLVPYRYMHPWALLRDFPHLAVAPLTSMFLHGGWLHLLSNMWMLLIFGKNVEGKMGHLRYLCFYLLSGAFACAAQLAVSWGSRIPVLGASGAIAGIMGAYFRFYPGARIVTLVPIFIFLQRIELPAFLFLGFWFFTQVYFGAIAQGMKGIAWAAHVGGFLAGGLLARRFVEKGR